jgi:hypothetical protein
MRGVRDETLALTINKQIQFFQDGLADEHLVAQHQSFLQGISSLQIKDHRSGHIYRLLTTIGIFSHPLPTHRQPEAIDDMLRQNRANGSGINEGIGLIRSHLSWLEHPTPDKIFIHRIGKLGFDSNFTHNDLTLIKLSLEKKTLLYS